MSDATDPAGFPRWAMRHARAFLVALHVPFAATAPLCVFARQSDLSSASKAIVVVAGAVALVLQLQHSLAATDGVRPPAWPVTFAVLAGCAYAPMWWFGLDWASLQCFVIASGLMLLRGRSAVLGVAGPSVGTAIAAGVHARHSSVPQLTTWAFYGLAIMVVGGAALYGAARLVEVLDELCSVRSELAELAVGDKRDLHDRIGHSLSAVSFKGDLAMRLLPGDPVAARAEIESLTGVARAALRDMRAVTRDDHAPSLRAELAAAVAVLGAAAVSTSVAADIGPLPPDVEAALASAVREAASNVLRDSVATWCLFTAVRHDGAVRLEIVNDGVAGRPSLAGLAERARAQGGSVVGTASRDGRFRLVVGVPEVRP